ncbi:hypothetical protein FORC53_4880 [Vibrio vulnificus]|uniref:Uncharacterized protein n=1 Tax=Vibrio vulnificus TaxID=672 RepID=A0AAN1UF27_VIBVL|nr:hypothetical protein FORC53_4880 [Vibrio vulnificus]
MENKHSPGFTFCGQGSWRTTIPCFHFLRSGVMENNDTLLSLSAVRGHGEQRYPAFTFCGQGSWRTTIPCFHILRSGVMENSHSPAFTFCGQRSW